MAKSSQINGIASTSIAVKMSMAMSIILMIILYKEELPIVKLMGVVLAITSVTFISVGGKSDQKSKSVWMLLVLFIGSGLLDFELNYVQKNELTEMTPPLFTDISLGVAGLFGFLFLLIKNKMVNLKLSKKNIIAGVILGIPNYFSIYLLLLSYQSTGWTDSSVLAITNVSVVLFSSAIGFLALREKATTIKIIGLICAIIAIATLYIAQ